jgi:hypothetical protein
MRLVSRKRTNARTSVRRTRPFVGRGGRACRGCGSVAGARFLRRDGSRPHGGCTPRTRSWSSRAAVSWPHRAAHSPLDGIDGTFTARLVISAAASWPLPESQRGPFRTLLTDNRADGNRCTFIGAVATPVRTPPASRLTADTPVRLRPGPARCGARRTIAAAIGAAHRTHSGGSESSR